MTASLQRIEALWQGEVGHQFIARCGNKGQGRGPFWQRISNLPGVTSLIEVGCGVGPNLFALLGKVPTLAGVDVSAEALQQCKHRTWGHAQLTQASASRLPYASASFDLVCTVGTLIHIPADALGAVFDELVRVSRRYVLLVEYDATGEKEIPWRGLKDVLWARPFGLELWRRHPELVPVQRGTVGEPDDFDTMTWSLFSKEKGLRGDRANREGHTVGLLTPATSHSSGPYPTPGASLPTHHQSTASVAED